MNTDIAIKQRIENALNNFLDEQLSLRDAATKLLNTLGYHSQRVGNEGMDNDRFARLKKAAKRTSKPSEKLRNHEWKSFHYIMQVTDDEVNKDRNQYSLFRSIEYKELNSYLFVAVKLSEKTYTRTILSNITRFINTNINEINRENRLPVMVVFRYGVFLTLAIIDRRDHKINSSKKVLEKITLIKDINLKKTHAAHRNILSDIMLDKLIKTEGVRNFETLHKAWASILNTEPLNKRFYRDLLAWYDWAKTECKFPDKENKMQVIRMITRLLFIWFLKEKSLVPEDIFTEKGAQKFLKIFDYETSDYYQAILQNLFFATLNTPINERAFRAPNKPNHTNTQIAKSTSPLTRNPDHRNANKYRYYDLLQDGDEFLEDLKQVVPFVNGGLFDSLDSFEGQKAGGKRVDCFTDWELHRKKLHVPAKLFFQEEKGIFQIFDRYKFTVEENTPVEQEVALDPELLGQVFENLLGVHNPETEEAARKATGSYYTPRNVVDYMVQEALVETLAQQVSPTEAETDQWLWKEQLGYLFDYAEVCDDASEWFNKTETEKIVRAISKLKILDPAVGSGAFPMGILHKLTLALNRLDLNNIRWEKLQIELAGEREAELTEISKTFECYRNSDYGRKLYLIQNSIFGVDIQPIACQIAKLRFFISLVIEQKTNNDQDANYGIRPLPNLETKFVAANTLIGLKELRQPDLQDYLKDDIIKKIREKIEGIRGKYFSENDRETKLKYIKDDEKFRNMLVNAIVTKHTEQRKQRRDKISYQVEQVTNEDDQKQLREKLEKKYKAKEAELAAGLEEAKLIALWNPYDQNDKAGFFDPEWMFRVTDGYDVVIGNPPYSKSENVPDDVSEQLATYYGWGGDLYDYFIFAGFKLVSEQGIFTYIANDSFVTFATKRKIRDLFLQNQLNQLVKAPANTFEANIYTAIFILLKSEVKDQHSYMSGEMNFPDFEYISNGEVEYATIYKIPDCKFLLSAKNDWVLRLFTLDNVEKYCFVLDTGIHSGNVRSKIFFTEDNGKRHRLLQGKQIQTYSIQWNSPKAKYKFCDIDYKPLPIPGIGSGGKPSNLNEYWHFCGDIENHHQPERLLMRQTDDDLIVAYYSEAESGRFYTDNTLHTILPKTQKTNLKYFLALFNSCLMNYIYHSISQEQGKSQAQVKIKVVRELPVVVPTDEEQLPIIALANEILAAKAADPDIDTTNLENEIDKLVYALYDLTPKEIAIVEGAV